MFLNSIYKDKIVNPFSYGALNFKSLERYYYKLLKDILLETTNRGYFKRNGNVCITCNCCKYYKKPCNIFYKGDKIKDILYNNGLNYLLTDYAIKNITTNFGEL